MNNGIKYSVKISLMIFLVSLAVLSAGLPAVNAFASTFLPDKTMELYKGETGEYCIYLQNTGEEDLIQIIKVYEGEEYIRNLNDVIEEFSVPTGTLSDDLPVCMEVRLPRDAEKGEKYAIGYGVTSPPKEGEGGMVSFAPVQIRQKFYLTERLDKKPFNPIPLYVGSAVIALATVLIAGYRYLRKTKKRKKRK